MCARGFEDSQDSREVHRVGRGIRSRYSKRFRGIRVCSRFWRFAGPNIRFLEFEELFDKVFEGILGEGIRRRYSRDPRVCLRFWRFAGLGCLE